jgi:hypothetical protein
MSLQTWIKQYMPTDPGDCKTDLEAIEHSLLKYQGLRKGAMAEHGVARAGGQLVQKSNFSKRIGIMGMDSCALCIRFKDSTAKQSCAKCPLYQVGEHCLDENSAYVEARYGKKFSRIIKVFKDLSKQCDARGRWRP